jgi:hypothetical protein
MPYIKSNDGRREALQRGDPAQSAGELNYQIFYFVKHSRIVIEKDLYWKIGEREAMTFTIMDMVIKFVGEKPNYQRFNDMAGCLILCAKEIKRRLCVDLQYEFNIIIDSYDALIATYENLKINENGDVE